MVATRLLEDDMRSGSRGHAQWLSRACAVALGGMRSGSRGHAQWLSAFAQSRRLSIHFGLFVWQCCSLNILSKFFDKLAAT
jgi:hypothetical protein